MPPFPGREDLSQIWAVHSTRNGVPPEPAPEIPAEPAAEEETPFEEQVPSEPPPEEPPPIAAKKARR